MLSRLAVAWLLPYLSLDETRVRAIHREQLLVCASLHDASLVDDADTISTANRREPMRDQQSRSLPHQPVDGLLHDVLALGVECTARQIGQMIAVINGRTRV